MAVVKFSSSHRKLTPEQLRRFENHLRVKLPEDYRRFLRQHNGGSPDKGVFKIKGNSEEFWLDDLLALHANAESQPDIPLFTSTHGKFVPHDCLIIGSVCRDDLLLLRLKGKHKGRVELKRMDESNDPALGVHPVAKNFKSFVASLYRGSEDFEPATLALDHARVRGQKLVRILKTIGCRKGHDHLTWLWPKYQGRWKNSPTWIELEKNKTYGYASKFDQRPIGHRMLRVTAAARHRHDCLRELAQALGKGAALLSRGG
jgi:SMI1/KNR4 family protein SUKH-1